MLRSVLLVFLTGWIAWFWIDKPVAGPYGLPPPSDSVVENFQRAFDILKTGHVKIAYIYIWQAHYLVLSLLGGILLTMTYNVVSSHLSRRRLRSIMLPKRQTAKPTSPPDSEDSPTDRNKRQ
jgi:hypothetical protein